MSFPYSRIVVVANPASKHAGDKVAKKLIRRLKPHLPADIYELILTEGPKHAIKVARDECSRSPRTLMVSVSGDGGIHEVANGMMQVGGDARPVLAAVRAGNANDFVSQSGFKSAEELARRLMAPTSFRDILRIEAEWKDFEGPVYAHSYASIGTPAEAARLMDETSYNRLTEKFLVGKGVVVTRPFHIRSPEGEFRLVALSFQNGRRMAKYLHFANQPDDGVAEMIMAKGKAGMLGTALRSAFSPLVLASFETMAFHLDEEVWLQADGEVYRVLPGLVTVEVVPRILEILA